jgi:hypothetical protein
MNRILAGSILLVTYLAAASASWFLVGNALWTGSDTAQVLVPALMTLCVYLAGGAAVGFVHSVERRSRLAFFALLAAFVAFVLVSLAKLTD